jgi:uncharacterized protein involved in response to NO
VTPIPRYRSQPGLALLSAGFRPFFLLSAAWASFAIPLWIAAFVGLVPLPATLAPVVWHVHEMVFGYAAATVAGFLLTAIPNWTGRMPLQGGPLAILVVLWLAGRVAMLSSSYTGARAAAALDLAFPLVFLAVVAREIVAGRNWRNLPMLAALTFLLGGNALVHLDAVGIADTAAVGNRIGVATLLMLIGFVGGRIICAASVCCCVPMAIPQAHLTAFRGDIGLGAATGAMMLSVLLGCAFVSRQFLGVFADQHGGLSGMAFGSWFAGRNYDHFGFYAPAFGSGVVFNLANLTLVGFMVMRQWRWGRPR